MSQGYDWTIHKKYNWSIKKKLDFINNQMHKKSEKLFLADQIGRDKKTFIVLRMWGEMDTFIHDG